MFTYGAILGGRTGTLITLPYLDRETVLTIPLSAFQSTSTSPPRIVCTGHVKRSCYDRTPSPTRFSEWADYWFYLTSVPDPGKRGSWETWESYVTSISGDYYKKPKRNLPARNWVDKVKISKTRSKDEIAITFVFSSMNALPNADRDDCSWLVLWAWYNGGSHPNVPIKVCVVPPRPSKQGRPRGDSLQLVSRYYARERDPLCEGLQPITEVKQLRPC